MTIFRLKKTICLDACRLACSGHLSLPRYCSYCDGLHHYIDELKIEQVPIVAKGPVPPPVTVQDSWNMQIFCSSWLTGKLVFYIVSIYAVL